MSPWGKAGVLGLPGHWEARVGADSQGGRHVAPAPLWTSAGAVGWGGGVVCVRQVGVGLVHALDFTPMNPSYPK